MNKFPFKNRLSLTLILCLFIASFNSCNKSQEVTADLAEVAIGTYRLSTIQIGGNTTVIPASQNYAITVSKVSANVVDMVM